MRSTVKPVSSDHPLLRGTIPAAQAPWRAWLAGSAIVWSASLPLAMSACMQQAPVAALATGERPVTGVPRFDRLFADVHASLLAVREARSEEAEARGALARRLGLLDAAPVDVLGQRLRERTARLSQDGLTLELEFTGIDDVDGVESHADANSEALAEDETPEVGAESELGASPSATLRTPGREPQRRELRLLEALAQAALSGATIYANMGHERRRTERLLVEIAELEGRVDTSFADVGDREKVRAKLAEAKQFLPGLNAQARDVSGSADILISLLDEAANTAPIVPSRRRPPAPPREAPAAPRNPPLAPAFPGTPAVSKAPPLAPVPQNAAPSASAPKAPPPAPPAPRVSPLPAPAAPNAASPAP